MAIDARISVGLPKHPKTKKLIKRLGQASAWNLVCLILWAASDRSNGDLSGMSDEDIELAADWQGDDGALVSALVEVRFLDGEAGAYVLHDWHEHNPWAAGADMRSAKARWNAAKRHHGIAEADRLVPEYAAIRNASSTTVAHDEQDASNAPSPSPSPSPSLPIAEAPQSVANKRGTRLPQDWALPMKWGEWTLSEFPSWNPQTVRAEADKFRDFWRAKAGKDACKLDWEATWRNWCRNAKPVIQGQPQRETPYAQHMRERVEQAAGSLAHIVAAKAPGQYQRIREPWEVAADEQRTIENGQTGTPAISMD